jgi:hypothetical protein
VRGDVPDGERVRERGVRGSGRRVGRSGFDGRGFVSCESATAVAALGRLSGHHDGALDPSSPERSSRPRRTRWGRGSATRRRSRARGGSAAGGSSHRWTPELPRASG